MLHLMILFSDINTDGNKLKVCFGITKGLLTLF
jgi:hypothetical protein